MQEYSSCIAAMESCTEHKYFAVSHLYKEEKPMQMHIHDCYEIYFSISGGKQFLIDNQFYDIHPGDIFIVNQYESHYLTQIDQMVHERIVLFADPEFIKSLSTPTTDLNQCFVERPAHFSHKISLNKEQQQRFLYYIDKITSSNDFGHDIVERLAFTELIVLLNKCCIETTHAVDENGYQYSEQVKEILAFINQNIHETITIDELSAHFYLSSSYICRIFKSATGTTINKYITARRIAIAKALLADGMNVSDACEQAGFNDYSNFLKSFTKAVGISPKKYATCCIS